MSEDGCDCDRCGLLETCYGPVPDDGGDYTILAVGEAPGEDEDKEGRPFVGRSGRLLRTALDGLGYPDVTYTNIVRCRPPDNKLRKKHIECCYQSLPIRDNTKLVLLFGNTPLKAVLGESGITTWNGVTVEQDGIIYAPALHPAYLLRNETAMDAWLDALDNALSAYLGDVNGSADEEYEYIYPVIHKRDIAAMCEELATSQMIAFDTEVAYPDAYDDRNRMLIMSFANEHKAWAVPIDHPADLAPIDDESLDMICNLLELHPKIIGHNIRFDQLQCLALLDCEFDAWGDTMLASFLVESRRGLHALKRLAGYYLGMFDYDADLKEYVDNHPECNYDKGGSYQFVPMDVLLPYAAKDAAATFLLHGVLYDKLTERQQWLYEDLMVPTSNALYRMQANGMAIDYYVAKRYQRVYRGAKMGYFDNIILDPMVTEYVAARQKEPGSKFKEFNPGSWQQKAMVLYGCTHATWMKKKYSSVREWPAWARKKYYDLKPLGESDGGNPSTKRGYIEPYRDECPLVDNLVMYGLMEKMLNTYIDHIANGDFASSDRRVRPQFNQHIVETGRLSSNKPNAQNIPTPEKEAGTLLEWLPIKNMFSHTWTNKLGEHRLGKYTYEYAPEKIMTLGGVTLDVNDGYIMSVDYSGMELRVFASLAHCEPMLEIHRSGKDFHTMVSSLASGLPEDQITKAIRYRYKWTNWTLLFGGDEYTLHRLYHVDIDEARETVETYYEMFPEVLEYKQLCTEFAEEHGYIETPFGRRRPLPYIKDRDRGRRAKAQREAVNTPVQGGAGEVTLLALVIVDNRMREQGMRSMIVNTVHDSLVLDVYPGELIPLAKLCVDVMENVIAYAARMMPRIDMDWLISPLVADVEVGSHYGTMKKLDVDWYHI